MNFRISALVVLSLAAVGAVPASAQNLRPGLWEINNKMAGAADPRMKQMRDMQKANMAEMRKRYDSMPPEQRKHMDDLMAKMGQFSQMSDDGGMTMKLCVTPEMAKHNRMLAHQRPGCTDSRSPIVGGVMKVTFSCANPKSSGEGTVTMAGDTGYTMDMKMKTEHGGQTMATSMASSGKWLAADCGDVKPPAMPPAMPAAVK